MGLPVEASSAGYIDELFECNDASKHHCSVKRGQMPVNWLFYEFHSRQYRI